MTRVKRGNVARARRKKILKLAKGFRGAQSKQFRTANQRVMQALRNGYRDRKKRKRDFRRLWIARINAASRSHGTSYSKLIGNMKRANIEINRVRSAHSSTCVAARTAKTSTWRSIHRASCRRSSPIVATC